MPALEERGERLARAEQVALSHELVEGAGAHPRGEGDVGHRPSLPFQTVGLSAMRWLALPAGIVLLVVTLADMFRTMVMPRAVRGRFRLTRVLFLVVWRPWRWIGVRQKTAARRERVLSGAAPLSLFVLLAMWASLAI